MKHIAIIAILATICSATAADKPSVTPDPFAGAFFPPELVLLARDRIGLTAEQREAFRGYVQRSQPRSDELRTELEHGTAGLAKLANNERLDEASLMAQLDKVLDLERELKHLHVKLLVAIKNLLTPEQQTELHEIAKNGLSQLEEDARKRLTEKMERVKEGAQRRADGGSDPSDILRGMEEKFKPLIEAGKVIEAEAELDRVLEQFKKD